MSKIIAGIDEAGRGPVLGPLVMVALAIKEEDQKKLEWLGVKDSKLLSRQAREEIFEKIRDVVHDFRIEVIEPDAIDLSLNSEDSNLNWLEADTSARLVSEMNPHRIIVDCPSINLSAYKKYFLSKLKNKNVELLVEHKADFNHIIVAGASVIAKVIRDRIIEKLHAEVGYDFGSGYLTDAKTQEFLQKYHEEFPQLFRRSWKSYKNVVEAKKQRKLGEF